MKMFVRIFGILIIVYLACCVLGPKSFNTEQSITVNASPQKVYALVSDFNQWKGWSPWAKRDPEMKSTIEGQPAMVGHKQSWVSDSEGEGSQTMIELKQDAYVKTELRFKDWDEPSYAEMFITPASSGTEIKWNMKGSNIPFIFRGLMMIMNGPGKLEQDYKDGLSGIKAIAEKS